MPTPSKRRRPKAIGAYIFAGGFTLGVSKHFDVACHLEESDYGVATARANFPTLPIHVGHGDWPIELLSEKQCDLIYGNPPCAAWSQANRAKTYRSNGWKNDPRVLCTTKHFELIGYLRPKVWVWESVTQAFSKGREFCDDLAVKAMSMGYSTSYVLHDAQWLGLPQVRKRLFMVCHRVKFTPYEVKFTKPREPVDVLRLAKPGEQFGRNLPLDLIKSTRPGEKLIRGWERTTDNNFETLEKNKQGHIKGRPPFGLTRLSANSPALTVAGYEIVHPTQDRWLSTEEMQVLCGFPQSFKFTPARPQARANEIARGVCPPIAEWLARGVAQSLVKSTPIKQPTITLYDFRKPGIEPVDITNQFKGVA
jgi:site-specific DNA-cytosine methylase